MRLRRGQQATAETIGSKPATHCHLQRSDAYLENAELVAVVARILVCRATLVMRTFLNMMLREAAATVSTPGASDFLHDTWARSSSMLVALPSPQARGNALLHLWAIARKLIVCSGRARTQGALQAEQASATPLNPTCAFHRTICLFHLPTS